MTVLQVQRVSQLRGRHDRGAAQQAGQLHADELRHLRRADTPDDDLALRQDLHDVVVLHFIDLGQVTDQGEGLRLGEPA